MTGKGIKIIFIYFNEKAVLTREKSKITFYSLTRKSFRLKRKWTKCIFIISQQSCPGLSENQNNCFTA